MLCYVSLSLPTLGLCAMGALTSALLLLSLESSGDAGSTDGIRPNSLRQPVRKHHALCSLAIHWASCRGVLVIELLPRKLEGPGGVTLRMGCFVSRGMLGAWNTAWNIAVLDNYSLGESMTEVGTFFSMGFCTASWEGLWIMSQSQTVSDSHQ